MHTSNLLPSPFRQPASSGREGAVSLPLVNKPLDRLEAVANQASTEANWADQISHLQPENGADAYAKKLGDVFA